MLFSTMAVELWGLRSKPLQRMGPAQHWFFRAMSHQGLSISEHGEFTASLDPCSHLTTVPGGKHLRISLSATSIHSLFSHCWEESVSAFPAPVRQLKPVVRSSPRVSFSLNLSWETLFSLLFAYRKHTGVHKRPEENHSFGYHLDYSFQAG